MVAHEDRAARGRPTPRSSRGGGQPQAAARSAQRLHKWSRTGACRVGVRYGTRSQMAATRPARNCTCFGHELRVGQLQLLVTRLRAPRVRPMHSWFTGTVICVCQIWDAPSRALRMLLWTGGRHGAQGRGPAPPDEPLTSHTQPAPDHTRRISWERFPIARLPDPQTACACTLVASVEMPTLKVKKIFYCSKH